jgi:predicted membrane channel-forming protein YqfA (hemolysin III family)
VCPDQFVKDLLSAKICSRVETIKHVANSQVFIRVHNIFHLESIVLAKLVVPISITTAEERLWYHNGAYWYYYIYTSTILFLLSLSTFYIMFNYLSYLKYLFKYVIL